MRTARVITIMLSLSVTACSAEKTSGQNPSNSAQSTGSVAPVLSSAMADATKMPDLFSGMWATFSSFVENDATLNVPYTEQAQRYVDAYKPKRDIPYAQEGCQSPGLPIAMRTGPIKFTYAPGLLSIYMQNVGDARFIKMNEKQGKTSPKYYGNSVGRWEGDTLVVETVDFVSEISFQYGVGKGLPPAETSGHFNFGAGAPAADASLLGLNLSTAIWGPHGEGMRIEERMRLVDAETMEVKTTIYDDTVWTKPYVMAPRTYKRIQPGSQQGPLSGEPEEWICTVSITSFDPETNTYTDKDPEEMVEYLNKMGK